MAVNELVDKSDEEVKAKLDQDIPEYFRENDYAALWDMVDRWGFFENRREVFEDAFEAHRNGKYTLSMPALAPQIEGMLRDISGEYDNDSQYMWKMNRALNFSYDRREPPPPATTVKELENALDSLLDHDFQDRHEIADRISLRHALLRVNELYAHVNFANLEFVDPANRHVILHGVAKDFSELASTKLFCAVQLVHEIALAYEEATGREPSPQ